MFTYLVHVFDHQSADLNHLKFDKQVNNTLNIDTVK